MEYNKESDSFIVYNLFIVIMSEKPHLRSKTSCLQLNQHETKAQQLKDHRPQNNSQFKKYLDPARQLPTKQYSLLPDMIGGWKPKKPQSSFNIKAVIPISYEDEIGDHLIKQLLKNQEKTRELLVYIGPRKLNSYHLHQKKSYQNPYSVNNNKFVWHHRYQISRNQKNRQKYHEHFKKTFLRFDSDFESGNLDLVIQSNQEEFDLYMRVDTNTRGHTNWYYYQVSNGNFLGTVKFNICNFRRESSLYQRGLKPYVCSERDGKGWNQKGNNVTYQKHKQCYSFLTNQSIKEFILSKYFVLSFDYQFKYPNDHVKFAYCVPYSYSQMLNYISNLKNVQKVTQLKSLSGLDIPILRVTDQNSEEHKKVALITSRVHPGESNSSYIMQGILQTLCGNSALAMDLKRSYVFYLVPMINPDGVVAGNYRTSLFGKDLNRTYKQSRKYAYPETFYLLDFALKLKEKYKKKFCIYIDLHGHSSKKNVFMYGPDYTIQTTNYEICRFLPRIMGNLTAFFRFYSCSFKISESKQSTARAIFSKLLNVPYSYTMETSNGVFFDSINQIQTLGNQKTWKEIGFFLCQSLNSLKFQKPRRIKRILTQKLSYSKLTKTVQVQPEQSKIQILNQIDKDEQKPDDKSDCDPEEQDLPIQILNQIELSLCQNMEKTNKNKTDDLLDKIRTTLAKDQKKEQKSFKNIFAHSLSKKSIQKPRKQQPLTKLNIIKEVMLPHVTLPNKKQTLIPTKQRYNPDLIKNGRKSKRFNEVVDQVSAYVDRNNHRKVLIHVYDQIPVTILRSQSHSKQQKQTLALLERLRTIK